MFWVWKSYGPIQNRGELDMNEIPFERTVCACTGCVACCLRQPGYLVPGDVKRILEFTGKPAKEILVDSLGGQVMDRETRIVRRIRTIVPKMDRTGRCNFLTEDNKCSIHPVAPFGCAYVDTHMTLQKGNMISLWGIQQVDGNEEYHKLRKTLPFAASHKPNKYKV
jgi:Fe-S-cluster containining protein